MNELTLGSWYSGGIDGFAYAAQQVGIKTLYHIESDRRAYKYLRKNYGADKIIGHDGYESVKNLPWSHIIAGGDPCQPSSNAGLKRGKDDPRYRWPFMFAGIRKFNPDWVINENVIGTVSNTILDQKISDLESIGYSCQAFNFPAIACNADHERKRIFLLANSHEFGSKFSHHDNENLYKKEGFEHPVTLDTQGNSFLRYEERAGEPAVFPVSHGVPDQFFRLGASGNSIVPHIPIIFLELIKDLYNN
ncbi:MAG: DNA cytosine methyltransferase [Cyclobacteriaceae bacterium]